MQFFRFNLLTHFFKICLYKNTYHSLLRLDSFFILSKILILISNSSRSRLTPVFLAMKNKSMSYHIPPITSIP